MVYLFYILLLFCIFSFFFIVCLGCATIGTLQRKTSTVRKSDNLLLWDHFETYYTACVLFFCFILYLFISLRFYRFLLNKHCSFFPIMMQADRCRLNYLFCLPHYIWLCILVMNWQLLQHGTKMKSSGKIQITFTWNNVATIVSLKYLPWINNHVVTSYY